MSLGPDPAQQQPEEEQFLSTFFCRALFDYQTDNDSSLSFRRDDIIEVLTRLESGWWDGLLGQERGWFPSNYVTIISDQEADAALAAAEATAAAQLEFQNPQATVVHTQNFEPAHAQNDLSLEPAQPHAIPLQSHSQTLSHLQNGQPNGATYPQQDSTGAGLGAQGDGPYPRSGTQSSDFWVPQVSADGRVSTTFSLFQFRFLRLSSHGSFLRCCRVTCPNIQYFDIPCYGRLPSGSLASFLQIYYVNTQTGQQSRDLPLDVDQDISEGWFSPPADSRHRWLIMSVIIP